MTFSDLIYLLPICLLSLAFMVGFVMLIGYLLFRSVDSNLRRCPSCKRGAIGKIMDTEIELIQSRIDYSKLTPVRTKREKVTDHYECKRCGHTWTRSFERHSRTPIKGAPGS